MRSTGHLCRVCGTGTMQPFASIGRLPAHIGVLWNDRGAALNCPRGDIDLALCPTCGFVYNTSFDAARMTYEEDYDNALDFSAVFTEYARSLAEDLIERYDLRGGSIIDVGCGKGEFLSIICEQGDARGIGFDPSAPADRSGDRVEFVREYYSRDHSHRSADLITCRHVFEHIEDPLAFLGEIRAAIGARDIPVYFEVPSLRNIIAGNSPWEIIYEHCSYFGEEAMRMAFERSGFVVEAMRPLYNNLYLGMWARPGAIGADTAQLPAVSGDVSEVVTLAGRFAALFDERVRVWRERVERWRAAGTTAVAWGAGARGTTFTNLIDAADRIPYLVDINPRKCGRFVPGTGQEIIDPSRLSEIAPDVVIVMNPVYLDEIQSMVADTRLTPEFITA